MDVDNNSFADWIAGNSGLGGLTAFTDDPDGDRYANGLEAWFETDPGELNAGLANLATDGTATTFSHSRNEFPPTDLTGFYQWSPNLVDWYDDTDGLPGGPSVTFAPSTIGSTTNVTTTASETMVTLFLRFVVTQD